MKKLFFLCMSKNGSFKVFLNEFNEIMDQFNLVEVKFDENIQALLILGQMPSSWDATITSISASFGKNEMNLSEFVEMIMTKEIKRIKDGASSLGSTLNMKSKGIIKSRRNIQVDRSNSKNWRLKSKIPNNNLQNQRSKKDID